MKVIQPLISRITEGKRVAFQISGRVELLCEIVESGAPEDDFDFVMVRLLEAGAGLPIGRELTVPKTALIHD